MSVSRFFPQGDRLPDPLWISRHKRILGIFWLQVPVLVVLALTVTDEGALHSLLEVLFVCSIAAFGHVDTLSKRVRESAVSIAVVGMSSLLVHFSNGALEMHFHYFIMLALLSVYRSIPAFSLAAGFIITHHIVVGAFWPEAVYRPSHTAAIANPVLWGGIHGLFVLGMVAVCLWRWKVEEELMREHSAMVDALAATTENAMTSTLHAESVQRTLDEMSGVIVHRLKSPLVPIQGFVDLLIQRGDKLDRQAQLHYLHIIARSSDQMNQLIDLHLAYAKGDQQGWQCKPLFTSDLDRLLTEWTESLRLTFPTVKYESNPAIPAVYADIELLEQLVHHLVENASKYGGQKDEITIRTVTRPNQVGIAVENLSADGSLLDNSIFDPLVRGKSSARGFGFGLNLVKNYARSMAGDVELTQPMDENNRRHTIFTIWLRQYESPVTIPLVLPTPAEAVTLHPVAQYPHQ